MISNTLFSLTCALMPTNLEDLPYTNCVYISPNNYKILMEHKENTLRFTTDNVDELHLNFGIAALIAIPLEILDDTVICMNLIQRKNNIINVGKRVDFFIENKCNKSTQLYVNVDTIDEEESNNVKLELKLSKLIHSFHIFQKQLFTIDQELCMEYSNGIHLKLKIISGKKMEYEQYCIFSTNVVFISNNNNNIVIDYSDDVNE